ncbi:MAG: hypothetical protein ACK5KL_21400 [Dysgonomonas sp.]|jgi:hypothetical protein|nr:hypothetical protein [Prevotella sp.]
MRKLRFLMPVGFLLLIAGAGAVVMLLWNWLMPVIFGLITINFWQALGIFILARILFGGFGFGRRGMGENPIHRKWNKMTPEQRKEFIESRRRFGFGGPFGRERFDMKEFEEHE